MYRFACLAVAAAGLLFAPGPAAAKIILVNGAFDASRIIAPPADVTDDPPGATNTMQQGFDEMQNVLLGADLTVDGGVIAAGTRVNSHMIFLNTEGFAAVRETVRWTFDGTILGVMSDIEARAANVGGEVLCRVF